MSTENILNDDYESYAREISELFEQDSRRFNRALTEEEEVKG